MVHEITVSDNDAGKRVDNLLRALYPGVPVSRIFSALRKGEIRIDGGRGKPETRVSAGSVISIRSGFADEAAAPRPEKERSGHAGSGTGRAAGNAGFDETRGSGGTGTPDIPDAADTLLYCTVDLAAFNKPAGLSSHGPGSFCAVMEPWLAARSLPAVSFRPGPLHRLDRGTSGVLFFGLSLRGARRFSEIQREHGFRKSYLALVDGTIEAGVTWDIPLYRRADGSMGAAARAASGGAAFRAMVLSAETKVEPVTSGNGKTLCVMTIESGRKHQIRVHAGFYGHPLAGDRRYGGSPLPGGYILHAFRFAYPHAEPDPVCDFRVITAPLPDSSRITLERFFDPRKIAAAMAAGPAEWSENE